jgi:acylphosphatase|nr:MAG: acylphosphatase [bacterium]
MPELTETRRAFRIHGRVQGVGFRMWTYRTASELGLRGTVRNMPDGTVEVVAAGPLEALDRLRTLLHEGPPAAEVARVDETEPPAGDLPAGFEIR